MSEISARITSFTLTASFIAAALQGRVRIELATHTSNDRQLRSTSAHQLSIKLTSRYWRMQNVVWKCSWLHRIEQSNLYMKDAIRCSYFGLKTTESQTDAQCNISLYKHHYWLNLPPPYFKSLFCVISRQPKKISSKSLHWWRSIFWGIFIMQFLQFSIFSIMPNFTVS